MVLRNPHAQGPHSLSNLNGGHGHIGSMPDLRKTQSSLAAHRPDAGPHPRRWIAVTDWLGAQKPLNLILGAVILIEGVAVLVHLL